MTSTVSRVLPLLAIVTFTSSALAGTFTLVKKQAQAVGGKNPRSIQWPLSVKPGDIITVSIGEGADNDGDKGLNWRIEDQKGRVIGKGFSKESKIVSWDVVATTTGANLIVEDKDTKLGKGKYDGNGFSIAVTCTREDAPKPAPKKKKK